MDSKIKGRVFMVGCPRSGTTLLQSLIAAHPEVASFPESNLFLCLTSPDARRGKLGIASKGARKAFNMFLHEMERPELNSLLSAQAFSMKAHARAFIMALDTIALQKGKHWWLEKTPYHLRRIEVIEKFVKEAKFIHIIRNGEDVVASLYEVTHKHPEIWGGSKDIDRCLSEWLEDIRCSAQYLGSSTHLIVRYEHLLDNPQLTIKRVCEFIGIDFNNALLEKRAFSADTIIRSKEVWKSNVSKPIKKSNSKKFTTVFSDEEQQYILEKISNVDLDSLTA